jgi:hypothetical protein
MLNHIKSINNNNLKSTTNNIMKANNMVHHIVNNTGNKVKATHTGTDMVITATTRLTEHITSHVYLSKNTGVYSTLPIVRSSN